MECADLRPMSTSRAFNLDTAAISSLLLLIVNGEFKSPIKTVGLFG